MRQGGFMPQKKPSKTTKNPSSLSWTAPEFSHYEKSNYWILGLIFIVLLLVAFAYLMKNWLMGIAFVLSGVALFMLSKRAPENVEHEVSEIGVKVGQRFYSFSKLKSFWFIETDEVRTLNFEPTRRISPIITLQLSKADSAKIRQFLLIYLPEQEGRKEDWFDKLSRILKI